MKIISDEYLNSPRKMVPAIPAATRAVFEEEEDNILSIILGQPRNSDSPFTKSATLRAQSPLDIQLARRRGHLYCTVHEESGLNP